MKRGQLVDTNRFVVEVLATLHPALVDIDHEQNNHGEGTKRQQERKRHVVVARAIDDGRRHERADKGAGLANDREDCKEQKLRVNIVARFKGLTSLPRGTTSEIMAWETAYHGQTKIP